MIEKFKKDAREFERMRTTRIKETTNFVDLNKEG